MSARNRIRVDVAIVGGGIAGLWLLNLLRGRGYSALLIERRAFGDGQTIRSQGMIHGGLKYALSGALNTASEAVAAMPGRWRACLTGSGEIDLRGVRVASDRCHLWSPDESMLARLGGFLASKALRGRVRRLDAREYPSPFDANGFDGAVYELDELVLDVHSLLARLAHAQRGYTLQADVGNHQFVCGSRRIDRIAATARRRNRRSAIRVCSRCGQRGARRSIRQICSADAAPAAATGDRAARAVTGALWALRAATPELRAARDGHDAHRREWRAAVVSRRPICERRRHARR